MNNQAPIEPLLRCFCAVARTRSFSEAARYLGLSRSAVSTQIAALERRVQTRLLERTTRSVRLTAEGEGLLTDATAMLERLDAIGQPIGDRARLTGVLRIDGPEFVGTRLLAEPLAAWLNGHPDLQVVLQLHDRLEEVPRLDADIALRFTLPVQARLRYRKLAEFRLITVAAPKYLERFGEPQRPEDLADHRAVDYLNAATGKPYDWEFDIAGSPVVLPARGPLCCNNTDAGLRAAIAGLGLYRDFRFVVAEAMEKGDLVEVLPHFQSPSYPLYALWQPSNPPAPRVAACLEWLEHICREAGVSTEA